jgi:iron complex transport system substrate-binding protein
MRITLRHFTYLLLWGALTVTTVLACSNTVDLRVTSSQQRVEDCRVVQHTMGKTCIPRNPQRIIALREDTLANSLALGIKPIASVFEANYPLSSYLIDKVEGIESVGGTESPNLEKILQLKPDLILANYYNSQRIYNQLSHIAPTVVLNVPFPPPSWKDQLEELATVLGKEDVSQKLINNYWKRIQKLQQALGDRRHNMNVSIASTNSGYGIYILGEKHFSGIVLSDVGLQRPPAQRGDFFYIDNRSEEKISDIDGDVLFFVACCTKEDLELTGKLQHRPLWKQLNVVQGNQVYFVGGHWYNADVIAINAILDDLFKYLANAP